MKLYYCYTPAHKVLVDNYFLPSIKDEYELRANYAEIQDVGEWEDAESWTAAIKLKIQTIIEAIEENMDNVFIYSDVDVQFFRPSKQRLIEAIEGKDIVFQRNCPAGGLCAGFMVVRANQMTLKLWKDVQKYHDLNGGHDQERVNILIKRMKNIKWGYLPREFFSAGYGGELNLWKQLLNLFYCNVLRRYSHLRWKPGLSLKIPKNIVMHHANFTTGVANKISQLEYVRSLYGNNGNINRNLHQKFGDQKTSN